MKQLTEDFAAHIASGATTLATCWRLQRSDGMVLGFTDHDAQISFDGVIISPMSGFDGGEATAKIGASVDTSEVTGFLSSDAISEADIRLGKYEAAIVETWRVNWRDVSVRHMLRSDTIGEITKQDGLFRAELRSAQHRLNTSNGRRYQSTCGTRLGTTACGIDLDQPAYKGAGTVLALEGRDRLRVAGLSAFSADWFSFGRLTWLSGQRAGKTDGVNAHMRRSTDDILTLEADLAGWIAPGDIFEVTAGCDRNFSTCRNRFGNQLNFRGFPHIPGTDFVLNYPRTGDALGGAPLIK